MKKKEGKEYSSKQLANTSMPSNLYSYEIDILT
jgi:hypothetical protein